MKNLIKKIRFYLNMSQTEFAEHMNVSFATVNRWENGRAVPNKLAQMRLHELCKARAVPVYDMTLEKIAEAAKKNRSCSRKGAALSWIEIRHRRSY